MLNLPDHASQLAALDQPLEPRLRELLAGRVKDAVALELAELTHIVAVSEGDSETDLVEAIGFLPLVSRIDGIRHQPDWDWLEQHQGWLELVYTVSNSGFAYILLIEDSEQTLPELRKVARRVQEAAETTSGDCIAGL